jgi:succinate dehydrogenase flavin-adding protein (antitoxin of CptAB toxin-antitoxin module)
MLRERLRQLREEYFTELSDSELDKLTEMIDYSSDELIYIMKEYSDNNNTKVLQLARRSQ